MNFEVQILWQAQGLVDVQMHRVDLACVVSYDPYVRFHACALMSLLCICLYALIFVFHGCSHIRSEKRAD